MISSHKYRMLNPIDRRRFLEAAVCALGAGPVSAWQSPSRRERPNVIFILADDLGWADLACYGHPEIKTPALDRLAQQGTRFTQFYVNSAVCSPSRTAFLTGNFPARHGIHGALSTTKVNRELGMPDALDPKAAMLPHQLQRTGYVTGHFGKWHLSSGKGAHSVERYGFDEHRIGFATPGWEKSDPFFWAKSTQMIVDEAVRFIEKHRDRSFYVNVWPFLPHAILNPTEEQMAPYREFGPPNVPYKGAHQVYYASVTDLDQQVGRLLQRLDELRLAENTLVLFSSDNGPEDMEIYSTNHSGVGSTGPFRGRKRSLYEGGVRVPFLARWPGRIPHGRVDTASVLSAVDVLPTIAKLAGSRLAEEFNPDGEEASEALLGRTYSRSKPLFWEWRFDIYGHPVNRSPMLAVREGKWKLLTNRDRSRVELYDVPGDPTELNNLAYRHPEIVDRLSRKLLEWSGTLPQGPIKPSAGRNDYPGPRLSRRPAAM